MPPTNANPLSNNATTTNPAASSSSAAGATASPNSKPGEQPQRQQSQPSSTQLRPPLYNAEDYASALRALFTNSLNLQTQQPPPPTSLILEHASTHPPIIPGQGVVDMNKHVGGSNPQQKLAAQQHHHHHHHHIHQPNSSHHVSSTQHQPEMSMKKFINGSELLFKLEADLRSAFPSFVQEFVSGDSDGVTCIVDALKIIHEALDHVNGLREQRKLVLDERSCVQCIGLMMRNHDAIPKLLSYAHGLYPMVQCTVSTNTATRVLALDILSSICESGGELAYAKVSEAVSTLRLRLGEPIRCKVLVGAISSAAAGVFQATGIRFFARFVACAPSSKFKVYLQVELEEAGLNVDVIRKSAELSPARESRLVLQELEEWDRVCVDVDTVVRQNSQLRNSVATLQQEIATLKDKIKKQESCVSSAPPAPQQACSSSSKYTKKKWTHGGSGSSTTSNGVKNPQQHPSHHRAAPPLSSTPIQTITTPVDSEEEAEQIHQILEDLHNIVNNEMLQHNNDQQQQLQHGGGSSSTTNTNNTVTISDIVPVVHSRPLLPRFGNTSNQSSRPMNIHYPSYNSSSEPNLFESESRTTDDHHAQSDSSDNTNNSASTPLLRVKNVVQQLENSSNGTVFSTTLPNFNTSGLASKFANFKSSKLEGGRGGASGSAGASNQWGCGNENMELVVGSGPGGGSNRVKSLENLDNFTLKWKYPVVGGNGGNPTDSQGLVQPAHMNHRGDKQQPNSLVVLQDYRMNRFGNMSGSGGGKKQDRGSPATGVAGLFSKNKKRQQDRGNGPGAAGGPVYHHQPHISHPQKTFQISLVKNGDGGGSSKINNLHQNYNDLGGPNNSSLSNSAGGNNVGGGSPSLVERVTDLPSGMY